MEVSQASRLVCKGGGVSPPVRRSVARQLEGILTKRHRELDLDIASAVRAGIRRAFNLAILTVPGPGDFPILNQIKPHSPLQLMPFCQVSVWKRARNNLGMCWAASKATLRVVRGLK